MLRLTTQIAAATRDTAVDYTAPDPAMCEAAEDVLAHLSCVYNCKQFRESANDAMMRVHEQRGKREQKAGAGAVAAARRHHHPHEGCTGTGLTIASTHHQAERLCLHAA